MSKQKMTIDEMIEELKGIQKFLCGEAKEVFDNLNEISIMETINTAIRALEIQNRKPFDPFTDNIDEGSYYCGFTAGKRSVTRWTSCDSMLPNTFDDMLVTDGENMAVGYYSPDAHAWDSVNFGWLENRTEQPYGIKKVIAWMPLPEQYKENNNE